MPNTIDNFDLENYKVFIQNFSVKNNVLYWGGKRIVGKQDINDNVLGEAYFSGGPTIRVADGGTGTNEITGIVKGNGSEPFTSAIEGIDYITEDSENTLKNKTIDARKSVDNNIVVNIGMENFAEGLVSNDKMLSENSSYKLATQYAVRTYIEHKVNQKAFGQVIKTPVRAATTENIDIGAVKDYTVIDGVILRKDDRILVKDQENQKENGIYVVGGNAGSTKRATDADTGNKLTKCSIFVSLGEVNKGSTWFCDLSTISEWNTNIIFTKISQYPVYSGGYGIIIDDDQNSILADTDKLFNKDALEPIATKYGGTGNRAFDKNSLVLTKEYTNNITGEKYIKLESLSTSADSLNKALLSNGTESPYWSTIKYPSTLNDKTLLYADNNEIKGKDFSYGFAFINEDSNLVFKDYIPENIKIGDNKVIYHEDGKVVALKDGGTGLNSISKDHFLYGSESNSYSETPITAFGRQMISLSNISDVMTLMGLGNGATLNIGTTSGTLASGDHEHTQYVTRDGNQYFTHPVIGVTPEVAGHLATKGYVDSISVGQLWQDPVNAIITELPTELFAGDRFLINFDKNTPDSALDSDLVSRRGQIATVNSAGTVIYTQPQKYFVVKDMNSGLGYIYNGEEWVMYSTNDPHNALSGVQGGKANEYYHLSHDVFIELTGKGITKSHKHMHNETLGLQGGDGVDYYHLTAREYAQIANSNFKYHNKLYGLQGGLGSSEEYYHLSSSQYRQLTGNSYTNLHTHQHNNLSDINGSAEGYHLSFNAYSALTSGLSSVTNLHAHSHNNLDNIQGGKEGEYYHINKKFYDIVTDLENLIKNEHNSLDLKQGGSEENNQFYHLDFPQYHFLTQGVDCNDLHNHKEYINKDGSVNFEASPEVPVPTKDTHIASKGYVDSLVTGLRWAASVKSRYYTSPPINLFNIDIGDRYIVRSPSKGDWLGLDNYIVQYNGGSWDITIPEYGTAVFVEDTETQIVWNGEEWVVFSAKMDHSSLTNLYGGDNNVYYHLSYNQHNQLTANRPCSIHYHPDCFEKAYGVLGTKKGGTGLDSVQRSTFLYATEENKLECKPMSPYNMLMMEKSNATDVREYLGCGNIASQNKDNIEITGGTITGISPLPLDCGGTGLGTIPNNSMLYVNNTGKFTVIPINEEGLDILNMNRNDAISYLGITEAKNVNTEVAGGRSKLFYLVAYGF